MFAQTTRRILIVGLILAHLLAQGMHVHMHAFGAPHVAAHTYNAAATHLESTLSMLEGHDETLSDVHVSLIGVLKHLFSEPLIAALFITLLFVLLRQGAVWFTQPRNRIFRPPHGHYFSPPLRAPPR